MFSLIYTPIKVTINEKNKIYKNFEEDKNLIIAKSDINCDVYDVLFYAYKNIKKVKIPSFIKRIASAAFDLSLIEKVVIPSNVTEIGKWSFGTCQNLDRIDIPSNSELKIIGESSFIFTGIRSFSITSNVKEIGKGAFDLCSNLKLIEINCSLDLESFFEKESYIFENGVTVLIPMNLLKITN